ncbi:MAG: glycosyltransferase family 2 protein [Candidatus Limnocylindrales bacterium]
MKVTVVTPVFNGMPWLPECIESVAQQRVDVDLEHFVYDGGSTDGSAEWLRAHTALGYEAIIGPDGGQTDALAKGFERGTGEIFGWLNADDVLEPRALKRVVDVFAADPGLAMVAGVCLIIDSDGIVIGAMPPPRVATLTGLLRLPYNPPQPATFFSARAYKSGGGLDRRYDLAMDIDLWLRLAAVGPIKTLGTEVLARYREHPDAKSIARSPASARQSFAIRRRHGMPLRSSAAIQLVRAGFIRPVTSPLTRPFRGVLRRLILGPSRGLSRM